MKDTHLDSNVPSIERPLEDRRSETALSDKVIGREFNASHFLQALIQYIIPTKVDDQNE